MWTVLLGASGTEVRQKCVRWPPPSGTLGLAQTDGPDGNVACPPADNMKVLVVQTSSYLPCTDMASERILRNAVAPRLPCRGARPLDGAGVPWLWGLGGSWTRDGRAALLSRRRQTHRASRGGDLLHGQS